MSDTVDIATMYVQDDSAWRGLLFLKRHFPLQAMDL